MTIYNVPQDIDNLQDLLVEVGVLAAQTGHTLLYDTNSTTPPTQIEILPDPTAQEEQALLALVDKYKNEKSVEDLFNASVLANKTPAEIYTAMQNAMDSWTTLADARADLREWLPLMAAIIAWKVQ